MLELFDQLRLVHQSVCVVIFVELSDVVAFELIFLVNACHLDGLLDLFLMVTAALNLAF